MKPDYSGLLFVAGSVVCLGVAFLAIGEYDNMKRRDWLAKQEYNNRKDGLCL